MELMEETAEVETSETAKTVEETTEQQFSAKRSSNQSFEQSSEQSSEKPSVNLTPVEGETPLTKL